MTRKVTAYACDYKCGQKVLTSKVRMEEHESRCFHNPIKKACASCKYFEKIPDGNGMEGTPYNHEWTTIFCNFDCDEINKLQNNCDNYSEK